VYLTNHEENASTQLHFDVVLCHLKINVILKSKCDRYHVSWQGKTLVEIVLDTMAGEGHLKIKM